MKSDSELGDRGFVLEFIGNEMTRKSRLPVFCWLPGVIFRENWLLVAGFQALQSPLHCK